MFAIGICYAKMAWPRIPFAAANLNTALTAVKSNMGLTVCAYGMLVLAFGWSLLWFVGIGDAVSSNNGPNNNNKFYLYPATVFACSRNP